MHRVKPEIIVVLDAMGVIYQPGADVDDLLVPFVREQGCTKTDSEIIDVYNDASRGLLSSRELWERLGVAGESAQLDREIVVRYSITEGLFDFLRWCADDGTPVACISNDVSEWAVLRARHFGLADAVLSWTISGDVGHRKPEGAIYDAFLSTVSAHATCIFVDDRLDNVTAAASKGMHGVLFKPGSGGPSPEVPHASDLSSLARLVAAMREAGGV